MAWWKEFDPSAIQPSTVMNLNPRLSFLASTLSALAFLLATPLAPAAPPKRERAVGTVKIENGGTIRINGQTAGNNAVLRCGDLIDTTEAVIASLGGKEYVIHRGSKVRLVCVNNGPVRFLVIFGGVHPVGDEDDTVDPLPYLAAFGLGNFHFPSIGGGSSALNGKIPIYNANGVVIGYALTDSNGKVIAYTNVSGGVLAFPGPNGTPVSSVFGPGAFGASLM